MTQRHDLLRTDALTVVFQRGGDVSDRLEVMGEYVLQFGRYKGKSFRWLLENDVGYTLYLFSREPAPPVASEGDNIVGFGARAKDTWRQIWESRADGYAAFIKE